MFNSVGAVCEPLQRHGHGYHERLKYYEVSYIVYAVARTLNPGVQE